MNPLNPETPPAPDRNALTRRGGRSYDAQHRAPRTPCKAPGCPFLTRGQFCPLHHPADPGTPMTTRTERAAPPKTKENPHVAQQ